MEKKGRGRLRPFVCNGSRKQALAACTESCGDTSASSRRLNPITVARAFASNSERACVPAQPSLELQQLRSGGHPRSRHANVRFR